MSAPGDDRFLAALTTAGGRLRVLSALNPGLWLSGLAIAGYTAAVTAGQAPAWPLIVVVLASALSTILVFVGFALRDPDRLQSEDYQLKKQSLTMVFEKGTKQMTTDVASIVVSSKNFPDDESAK